MRGGFSDAVSDFWPGLKDDWADSWFSLLCGVAVLYVFSQAWLAPLFGYSTNQASSGAMIRNFYYPFYLAGAVLAVICWRQMFNALWRTPLMLTLLALCGLSYLWSIDPSGTLRRMIALIMTMVAGYALAARFSWQKLTEVVAVAFTIMMLMSAFLAIFLPHLGKMQELFPGAWRGVWLEKNNLGSCMSIGFVAAAAAATKPIDMHEPRLFFSSHSPRHAPGKSSCIRPSLGMKMAKKADPSIITVKASAMTSVRRAHENRAASA